jgi:hypothetical protein
MKHDRHEFSLNVKDLLARRASFICSNPDCRSMTLAPSSADSEKYIYVGVAAHLTAAAPNGARYDSKLTPDQRASIDNAIFLCGTCSMMVDKNNGIDFPLPKLQSWKLGHEEWVRVNLNKRLDAGDVQTVNIGPNGVQNGSVIITQNQLGGQVAHSIINVGLDVAAQRSVTEAEQRLVADRELFSRLRTMLPHNPVMSFFRHHDYGASFELSHHDELYAFRDFCTTPDCRFLTPELEEERRAFQKTTDLFAVACVSRIFSTDQPGWVGVPSEWLHTGPGSDSHTRFEEAQTTLNTLASDMYVAYDRFIERGRSVLNVA